MQKVAIIDAAFSITGVAISKTLVEQMNGEIIADYNNGRISVSVFFREHSST